MDAEDTIAAIATAAGGGVGVIRVAGPEAVPLARRHFRSLPDEPEPRRMYHGWWHDGAGRDLDEGLLVVMPGPRSYTGDDVVEVHLHGGALNLRRCLEVLWPSGARPAEPGEFTRRAFLNGRLDLTRAEAVADLITARTDRALAQARSHLGGRLYRVAEDMRERLLALRARLEVNIDFVEEDVPPIDASDLEAEARAIASEARGLADTWRRGRLWREGARVALTGAPNAGKSSLFNALCERDRAIVTEVAGTTRDTLDETVDLLGVPVVLVDTAGLRDTTDVVEAAGIDRTRREAGTADLVLHLVEVGRPDGDPEAGRVPVLRVASKADRPEFRPVDGALTVSAVTGEGLDTLREAVVDRLGGATAPGDGLTIGRERHRVSLVRTAEALEQAAEELAADAPPELIAVDVQEATDALGELVGLSTIEDVLDRLFGEFCIGK
ncbi:MAG: tRNA uridine-5-carboxymethylaminomethyl(34) synthesis GTPase MnmE [Myxococcota bacterium]